MGFASGLPLALTGSTLSIWLAEEHLSLATIGLFAGVGLAYTLKFLWAPAADWLVLPLLTRGLGRRRGWALAIEAALALALVALGRSDPARAPLIVAALAVLVAFLSASQDIVIDAFRIELLSDREQGAGAAATQMGYRVGIVASTAGALYLATFFGWPRAYAIMAALLSVGAFAVLAMREPSAPARSPGRDWFAEAVLAPFADILTRQAAWAILVFVVLYKFGDALAGVMSNPFYVILGFSKIEIANVAKAFGIAASIAGVLAGGGIVYRLGVMPALMACGILQMMSNLMYIVQLWAGPDVAVLALTIAVENFTGGMASAAFVAYLSGLCSPAFTATQYALLSALAATSRTVLAASGGWLAQTLGWAPFFALATAACLPGLALLAWLMRRRTAPAPL
jgi:PAT family beta-lactamase induction signal transducer AmpG